VLKIGSAEHGAPAITASRRAFALMQITAELQQTNPILSSRAPQLAVQITCAAKNPRANMARYRAIAMIQTHALASPISDIAPHKIILLKSYPLVYIFYAGG